MMPHFDAIDARHALRRHAFSPPPDFRHAFALFSMPFSLILLIDAFRHFIFADAVIFRRHAPPLMASYAMPAATSLILIFRR